MTKPRTYNVVTFFCGSGYKTLGLLRSRSRAGSRFASVGAFDVDAIAVQDFRLLTGAEAHVVDLGAIETWQLADLVDGQPDFVVMSPPCKGFSGCLPEGLSKTARYESLNRLALRSIDLAIESWPRKPKVILLENVPRMLTRGADLLAKMTATLRRAGYEVNLEPHDCGEWGGLAQKRDRLLLVARLRDACPSHLLRPPNLGLRPMSSVLWTLPPPVPGSTAGGPHHVLPRLAPINWLRLATIPAGQDWRAIPEKVRMVGDIRVSERRRGGYGVCSDEKPSHVVRGRHHVWEAPGSISDPRLAERAARQNGGFGVNDSELPSHSVVAEGSVRNTWSSVVESRLGCSPRSGTMGVSDPASPARTVIGVADVHNSTSAVADPRSELVEPRVPEQNRGNFGVQDPARPSATVRAQHPARTAPSSVADGRDIFVPTHELVAGQPWTGDRGPWVAGDFWLVGPELKIAKGGRPEHVIIRAPDGTVHRPMTTAELMLLQGGPVWHRPGDPTDLEIGEDGGQWVQLHGSDAIVREHNGNGVPVSTAKAIGGVILELLDLGASESFSLSSAGIWVREQALAEVSA